MRHEHTRLGERPSRRPYIWAITRVQPPEETNIATTAEDLLPPGADLEGAAARNQAGLEASGITAEAAKTWVRTENTALIEHVGAPRLGGDHTSRLSPQQRALLEQANQADDLEHLVHLNERLQRLSDGVDLLETGEGRGPRAYSAENDPNAATHAASGYDLTAGGIPGDRFDTTDERPTTGLLENVRRPLAGFRATRAAGRRGRPR